MKTLAIDPALSPPGRHCKPQSHPDGGEGGATTGALQGADGFTLVELLVVLALIAILAGMLLPMLGSVREQAYQTTCLSNVRQITHAHLIYMQDWDERFPDWRMPASPRPAPFGTLWFWPQYFRPYVRSEAIYFDPGASREGAPEGIRLADYSLLTWGPGGFGRADAPTFRWPGPPMSLAQVVRPAETLTLIDGWTATSITERVERHGAGTNVSFVDGHACWLTDGEFWRLETNGWGFYWLHYGSADR